MKKLLSPLKIELGNCMRTPAEIETVQPYLPGSVLMSARSVKIGCYTWHIGSFVNGAVSRAAIDDDDAACSVTPYSEGFVIRRSGKPRQTPFDSPFESSQILIEKGSNISVNGNTFAVGRDDGGKGTFSPDYGIVMRECTDCVISANALQKGSLKQNIVLDSCRDVELLGNVGRSVEEDAQK